MELKNLSVEELKALVDEAKAVLKAKRAEAKENAEELKAELDTKNRAELSEGDKVVFRFNKDEIEGTIVRKSEKSVTVEFVLNGEKTKRYRKYSEILRKVA
jgi:ElaB/YqjD/DUF883 family membrane-anchored ribosome-binding protein